MQKKVVVISFIVVLLIWVGYMVTRHMGLEKTKLEADQETYEKLMEIAKKSPHGAMRQVGKKLNQYKAEKGSYPERLMDLYPDYIPHEAFIRDIQWEYKKVGDNDFSLKKTITVDGAKETTVIAKNLKVRSVGSTAYASVETHEPEPSGLASDEELGVMVASPEPVSDSESTEETTSESEDTGEIQLAEQAKEAPDQLIPITPEIVSTVKEEIAPGVDPKLGRYFLVWKDENGRLGFGNMEYPTSSRLSVYHNGMYHQIDRNKPLQRRSRGGVLAEKAKTKDEIASSISQQNLVWRNKDGTLGFGNVDYPSSYRLSVYSKGAYQDIDRAQSLKKGSNSFALTGRGKTKDEIASSISQQNLVWRNKDGTLGFGNMDYPKSDNVSHVNIDGLWEEKRNTKP